MREVRHQFHANPHFASKREILQEDGHSSSGQSFAHTYVQYDLRVDPVLCLIRGYIGDVVWGKRDMPVHLDNVFEFSGVSPNFVDPWSFVAQGKSTEPKGIQESWGAGTEDLVNGRNDCRGQDGFIYAPEAVQKVV